jgi:hypothetical protein
MANNNNLKNLMLNSLVNSNNTNNNAYEFQHTGRLSPKMNPVKRGQAAAFCRTEGGPGSRINAILASPYVGNTTRKNRWQKVKNVATDQCNRLNRYTQGEDVDVDVGYLMDVEQRIKDWKKNAALKQSAGKRKTRRMGRKYGKKKGTRSRKH